MGKVRHGERTARPELVPSCLHLHTCGTFRMRSPGPSDGSHDPRGRGARGMGSAAPARDAVGRRQASSRPLPAERAEDVGRAPVPTAWSRRALRSRAGRDRRPRRRRTGRVSLGRDARVRHEPERAHHVAAGVVLTGGAGRHGGAAARPARARRPQRPRWTQAVVGSGHPQDLVAPECTSWVSSGPTSTTVISCIISMPGSRPGIDVTARVPVWASSRRAVRKASPWTRPNAACHPRSTAGERGGWRAPPRRGC